MPGSASARPHAAWQAFTKAGSPAKILTLKASAGQAGSSLRRRNQAVPRPYNAIGEPSPRVLLETSTYKARIPLAGAALVLAAGYAYFTAPKSAVEAAKRKGKQAASDASDQTKDLAEKVKRDAKEQGSKTAKELSGKGGHGPFRAE